MPTNSAIGVERARAEIAPSHVLAGSFRPSRHHKLLAGPAVGWPALAAIQGAYAAATSEPERRAAAVAFLEAVRELTQEETVDEPPNPFSEELERIFALPAVPMRICDDERAVDRYYRAMSAAKLADVGVPTSACRCARSPSGSRSARRRSDATCAGSSSSTCPTG